MKVLIAGMGRCGSTLVFNILRLAMNCSGGWFAKYNPTGEKHQVVKCHEYEEKWANWADKIITPRRDLRTAVLSVKVFRKAKTFKKVTSWADDFVKWDRSWKDHEPMVVYYEDYMDNPSEFIKSILDACDVKHNIRTLRTSLDEIKSSPTHKGVSGIDLMFKNHIMPKDNTIQLTEKEIKYIETQHKDWLLENGYKI